MHKKVCKGAYLAKEECLRLLAVLQHVVGLFPACRTGVVREFQLLEQDTRSPERPLRRRVDLNRVVEELSQDVLNAWLPLALFQAVELPLEECAGNALDGIVV